MTFPKNTLKIAAISGLSLALLGCAGDSKKKSSSSTYNKYGSSNYKPTSNTNPVNRNSLHDLYRTANVRTDILSRSARSRTGRYMRPLYITIHSTQNWSKGADAYRHALALKRGALGKIGWHFTTDENVSVQHLPTNEEGNHAENYYGGPGNKYSIGIEMCEHPGNSLNRTVDRTARLTAYLMHKHKLPLNRVVPHYKWRRKGSKPHKNCPHFLLDNGRPGRKWDNFLKQVDRYYKSAY